MLRFLILFSFRNLWRFRSTTALQVVGFIIGLGALLPVMMVLHYHLTFDAYHEKASRIVRLSTVVSLPAGASVYAATSKPLAPLLKEQMAGLEEVVRCRYVPASLSVGDKDFGQGYPLFADPAFFRVFTAEVVAGSVQQALGAPDGLVINESTAGRLFGADEPLGKVVSMATPAGDFSFQVKAVVKDYPENVTFDYTMVAGISHIEHAMRDNLGALVPGHFTYLLMRHGVDDSLLREQLARVVARHFPEGLREVLSLLPVAYGDVHYTASHQFDTGRKGSKLNNLALGLMGLFLLLVSLANFVNLSTALLLKRSKEMTIRRTMGERPAQQYLQLQLESAAIVGVVMLVVGVEAYYLVPEVEAMLNITLRTGFFGGAVFYAFIFLFGMVVAAVAGTVPFLLFSARSLLNGPRRSPNQSGGLGVRYSLLAVQMIVSVLFALIALGMDGQLRFIRSQDLGFDKEGVVAISISDPQVNARADAIKQALLQLPYVEAAAASLTPINGDHVRAAFQLEDDTTSATPMMNANYVDADFADVYRVRLVAGRFFSRDFPSDRGKAFILNQKAVEALGLPSAEEAVGMKFSKVVGDSLNTGTIVGVAENYHFQSLYQQLEPMVWQIVPTAPRNLLAIRINPQAAGTVPEGSSLNRHIERRLAEAISATGVKQELEFTWLADALENAYREDDRLAFFVRASAGVIVVTALLGVFGLVSFILETRRKEIGIRKLLGADLWHISSKMGQPLAIVLLVGLLAGAPAAYYFLGRWLDSFAYHATSPWWYLPLAGAVLTLMVAATSFRQMHKAANTNPADVLREE